jgi:hypothetical protein|tara:strand:+ start:118 stop:897 length:780 start_codon:yes stop_codon:yes gene_type:complete
MADKKDYQFPTEEIDLPSKGQFYPKDNPLSSGKIDIKYMTAREEDILTSQNLIRKGIVIDKLLKSLIVTPGVDFNTMHIGDKNAVMVAARVLGYGAKYKIKVNCPSCSEENIDEVDLGTIEPKEFGLDGKSEADMSFKLPASKRKVTYKLLTHGDEIAITKELESLRKLQRGSDKVEPEITTRLRYVISSIDNEDNRQAIKEFVDKEFLSRDSRAFRDHLVAMVPDIDLSFNFNCDACDHFERTGIPLTAEFFWPAGER